jgi:hypothetical protein
MGLIGNPLWDAKVLPSPSDNSGDRSVGMALACAIVVATPNAMIVSSASTIGYDDCYGISDTLAAAKRPIMAA